MNGAKYRKKPVVIEAIQFTSHNYKDEIVPFTKANAHHLTLLEDGSYICYIDTLEGEMVATEGDYIIKGVNGEFYPCKPDIFRKTYEQVKA